jgi:type II secretory pathway component PulL
VADPDQVLLPESASSVAVVVASDSVAPDKEQALLPESACTVAEHEQMLLPASACTVAARHRRSRP